MYSALYAELRGEVPHIGGQTIAEGIAVKQVGRLNIQICKTLVNDVMLVDEPHLEQAVALYANVEKTIAEGAGAASLAALLAHPARFAGKKVGLILCGAISIRGCWRRC